eukprot:gnl/Hemi2/25434_TR8560_c0_g1_i1.p2 gnl/Hemi2/25434_TR8560_c0_g1~~gnl/Hemi2/25434_TR8560_c0_g1_i1.p2  ORF type:complete len:217 (-),score=83.04 gnl/Hemi2/25434_TR8560_c0_g1_i1:129-779(-)
MSKLHSETLKDSIKNIIENPKVKNRKFTETLELQIGLKNYNTQVDKRFSGQIRLPFVAKPRLTVCIFGDTAHCDQAKAAGIPCMDVEALKNLNKNKKLIKKLAQKYDQFLASESLIKLLPRILGPQLNKVGKFPGVLTRSDDMKEKIAELQATVKFQLKKVLCMGVSVGHAKLEGNQIATNIQLAVNFLCSLLKKNWQNIRSLHIKSTFSPAYRIY